MTTEFVWMAAMVATIGSFVFEGKLLNNNRSVHSVHKAGFWNFQVYDCLEAEKWRRRRASPLFDLGKSGELFLSNVLQAAQRLRNQKVTAGKTKRGRPKTKLEPATNLIIINSPIFQHSWRRNHFAKITVLVASRTSYQSAFCLSLRKQSNQS